MDVDDRRSDEDRAGPSTQPKQRRDADEEANTDSEGSGDDLRPGANADDSSEEDEENSEEVRQIKCSLKYGISDESTSAGT